MGICKNIAKDKMNALKVTGKFLDQPQLVGRFSKIVPKILVAGSTALLAREVIKAPKEEKKKTFIKNFCVIAATVTSALLAPKIASKIIKEGADDISKACSHHHEDDVLDLKEIKKDTTELVNKFVKNNPKLTKDIKPILEKSKTTFLNLSETNTLFNKLKNDKNGQKFLNKLIPEPENIDSKHIFGEIGRISVMGLVPVLGGISGGILGDKLTEKNWKEKIPNKIKEGTYQYLANIFLCNVGAGSALLALEKANCKSKSARAVGMIGGIILAGVVFGSAVANLVGKFCIDPLLHKNKTNHKHTHQDLYSERRPEPLDIGLHVDDIATVAVLSGLKWIEPALPVMYAISGYRAGIGYRNGETQHHHH